MTASHTQPSSDSSAAGRDTPEVHEADRFRTGISRSAITSLLSIVLGLGGAVLISRRFGSELFGEFVTVTAPLAMLTLLSSVQEQVGFMHVASSLPGRSGRFSALAFKTYLFSETLTLIAAVVVFGISWWFLHGPAEKPELVLPVAVLLGGYVVFGNLAWNIDGVLNARRASGRLALVRIAESALQPMLPLVISLWWHDLRALVAGVLLTTLVGALVRVWVVRAYVTRAITTDEWVESRGDFRVVYRTGLQVFPGSVSAGLLDQTAIWIVRAVVGGAPAGDRVVGSFGRANNLTWRLQELTYRVSALLLPSLSDTHSSGDDEGFRSTGRMAVAAYIAPLAGLVAILAACSPNALRVFGDDFVDGASAMRPLVVASLLIAIDIFAGMVLIALGQARLTARTSMLGAAVMLVLIYPLTMQWSATGAAMAVLIGQSVGTAWRLVLLDRTAPGGVRSMLPPGSVRLLVPPLTAGLSCWLVVRSDSSILLGMVGGAVGVVAFVVAWLLLGLRSLVGGSDAARSEIRA